MNLDLAFFVSRFSGPEFLAADDVPQFHSQLRVEPLQDIHFHVGAEFILEDVVSDPEIVVSIGVVLLELDTFLQWLKGLLVLLELEIARSDEIKCVRIIRPELCVFVQRVDRFLVLFHLEMNEPDL